MFCKYCGAQINDNADVCVNCGCSVRDQRTAANGTGDNNRWLVLVLLCFFLGCLGIHRFYVGKTVTGVVQLLTAGGCGIWALIDFIIILTGNFTDENGTPIKSKM